VAGGPGQSDCGEKKESCCTSTLVTGGTFYTKYRNDGSGPTDETNPVTVSSFRLDKYPVTVGRFRQFVNAWNGGAGYTPPAGSGKHTYLNGGNGLAATGGDYEPGWVVTDNAKIEPTNTKLARGTWTAASGTQENLPINVVNWYEAYAFCIWDGGFLPSDAEWEYAAAGGSQQREYPWGSNAPGTANHYAIYGCYYPNGSGTCAGTLANIAPVGTATLGAGRWGQLDLAGEVFEWILGDWSSNCDDPRTDCTNVTPGSDRVVRGGDFSNPASYLLPTYRIGGRPATRGKMFGIRCSRAP
jgi:formylglycine-generating enzyme required for sulfatase activity